MCAALMNERDIVRRILKRELIVTPIIDPLNQIGSTSIDLRLGYYFEVFNITKYTHLELIQDKEELEDQVKRFTTKVHILPMKAFILHPEEFVLACTLEYFKLPLDIAGRLEGRSTWGRLGLLVHATAGFVDPGFEGTLTFELKNAGKTPIPLYPGMRVAQICFFKTATTIMPYTKREGAKYFRKIGTTGSMLYKDPEFAAIYNYYKKMK